MVCFGDSNTYGTPPTTSSDGVPRYGSDVRWTRLLADALGPSWRVQEEGLPGRTTVHPDLVEGPHVSGLAALPVVLGSHSPIDILVIMLGTNDLKARFSVPGRHRDLRRDARPRRAYLLRRHGAPRAGVR